MIFFLFSQKIDFDISCKLSPEETICMKRKRPIFWESKKNISQCGLLNFLPSTLSVQVNGYTSKGDALSVNNSTSFKVIHIMVLFSIVKCLGSQVIRVPNFR